MISESREESEIDFSFLSLSLDDRPEREREGNHVRTYVLRWPRSCAVARTTQQLLSWNHITHVVRLSLVNILTHMRLLELLSVLLVVVQPSG